MIKVTYFFRKPFQDYYSIEGVFNNVQKKLDTQKIRVKNYYLKRLSKGLINRVLSCFEVLKHQGDINHITGDIHFVSYLLPKSKSVLTIHDLAPLKTSQGFKRSILKFFWYQLPLWTVKYVTVISEFTRMELMKELNVNPDKIKVIPNPLPLGLEFQPKKNMSLVPVLLQMGTAYNKNLEGLIIAIQSLDVKLSIVGTLSTSQTAMLNANNIDYTNHNNLNYNQVIECYENADIVCFATFYEGFGLPIVEAQAIGRPVITSNRCAMPDTAGSGAFLIDPEDTNAYKNAIEDLIIDTKKRNQLIADGKQNIKRFSSSTIANQYYELYKLMNDERK